MLNIFKKKKKDSSVSPEQEGASAEKAVSISRTKEIEENIAIHVMPKRFRVAHEQGAKAKTVGLFIVIGGGIFLIGISVFLYFYLFKSKPVAPIPKEEPAITETETVPEEPKKAEETAIEEIKVEEVATSTEEEAPMEIPVEEISVGLQSGEDSDKDGLTNKEEILFNSDQNLVDSDGDGFDDRSEVINLYSPTGTRKLEDGSRVVKYLNNTYKYKLIYPTNWSLSRVGGDDSIVFKSSDNHFIQVIVQSNSNKESIDSWYKAQFNESSIDSSRLMESGTWEGVKNENGLIIYLTDKNKKNIYTVTYNFGTSDILEYQNIFEMIIKSFEIVK